MCTVRQVCCRTASQWQRASWNLRGEQAPGWYAITPHLILGWMSHNCPRDLECLLCSSIWPCHSQHKFNGCPVNRSQIATSSLVVYNFTIGHPRGSKSCRHKVFAPQQARTYTATKGGGAFFNGQRLETSTTSAINQSLLVGNGAPVSTCPLHAACQLPIPCCRSHNPDTMIVHGGDRRSCLLGNRTACIFS